MGVPLASAFVRLRPQADESEFRKSGAKAGKSFGDELGKGVKGSGDAGLDAVRARFAKSGGESGKAYADGFTRDSAGKIRDAQGKFVRESEETGTRSGKGF